LVTGDVSSLYTNMGIDRMLKCVRHAFRQNPDDMRPDESLIKLLEISLKNNDFTFDGKFYKQILGCAMGKRFAPALANLYLLELDEKAMNGFPIKPLYFFRYLDDIFFIWRGNINSLKEYEQYINKLIPDIKIIFEHSQTEISFLDNTIYIKDEQIRTRTFFKATDTHQLLHSTSFQTKHTFNGLVKSQFIRFKRLSSTRIDYENSAKILIKHLSKRGYNNSTMRKLKNEIWFTNRDKRTNDQTQEQTNDNKEILPIITDYCKLGQDLSQIYKNILRDNNFFHNFKLITAFTNNKNVKKILVRSQLAPIQSRGFHGRSGTRCLTCRLHTTPTSDFYSDVNKQKYNLNNLLYYH